MKSIIILITLFCSLFLIGQETVLPMKGKYIFYEFKEKTENTKRPILEYLSQTGKGNALNINCGPRYREFSKISYGILKTDVSSVMVSNPLLDEKGEAGIIPGMFLIVLSPKSNLLDNSGLGVLLNLKKKKLISQGISADIVLKVHSDKEYSLIITNFKYNTTYMKGTLSAESGTEVINVEELMTVINDKENKYRKTEIETAQKYIDFIDNLANGVAKIFHEELTRLYEIDELY